MWTSFSPEVEQPGHLEYFLHDDDANVGYDYDDDDYIWWWGWWWSSYETSSCSVTTMPTRSSSAKSVLKRPTFDGGDNYQMFMITVTTLSCQDSPANVIGWTTTWVSPKLLLSNIINHGGDDYNHDYNNEDYHGYHQSYHLIKLVTIITCLCMFGGRPFSSVQTRSIRFSTLCDLNDLLLMICLTVSHYPRSTLCVITSTYLVISRNLHLACRF